MSFLEIVKNLFLNEGAKGILPFVVSFFAFFFFYNFLTFINAKNVKKIYLVIFSSFLTGLLYIGFIKVINLRRLSYIFDIIPIILIYIEAIGVIIRECTHIIFVVLLSNVIQFSITYFINSFELLYIYEQIKNHFVQLKIKFSNIISKLLDLGDNITFISHNKIFKINCSFSC